MSLQPITFSNTRATILVWTLTFYFRRYHWILWSLRSLSVTPNSYLFFILKPDHSRAALITVLLHIKMLNGSTLLSQEHILRLVSEPPPQWSLEGTFVIFPTQNPVLFLVGVFNILYMDTCHLPHAYGCLALIPFLGYGNGHMTHPPRHIIGSGVGRHDLNQTNESLFLAFVWTVEKEKLIFCGDC